MQNIVIQYFKDYISLKFITSLVSHSSILAWKSPMDIRSWWAMIHGVVKRWTRLSMHTHTHTHTHNGYNSCALQYNPLLSTIYIIICISYYHTPNLSVLSSSAPCLLYLWVCLCFAHTFFVLFKKFLYINDIQYFCLSDLLH